MFRSGGILSDARMSGLRVRCRCVGSRVSSKVYACVYRRQLLSSGSKKGFGSTYMGVSQNHLYVMPDKERALSLHNRYSTAKVPRGFLRNSRITGTESQEMHGGISSWALFRV